jgi:hypothetical protein
MSFFQVTEEEIKNAHKGKKKNPEFKHDEKVEFSIKEVKDKGEMIIIACDVLNTEFKGEEYAFFIKNGISASRDVLIRILMALFDDTQIKSGQVTPVMLINKRIESVAKVSAKEGRTYCNFYDFKELEGGPAIGGTDISSDDIPF